jgi:hypothetical protein
MTAFAMRATLVTAAQAVAAQDTGWRPNATATAECREVTP